MMAFQMTRWRAVRRVNFILRGSPVPGPLELPLSPPLTHIPASSSNRGVRIITRLY